MDNLMPGPPGMGCFAKCDARLEVHQGGKAPQQALQDALLGSWEQVTQHKNMPNWLTFFSVSKTFFQMVEEEGTLMI
jgi:hypothetical protein